MAQQPTLLASMEEVIAEHRLWFLVLGVLLIVLGIIAVAFPFMTTIAVKIFLGWLFLIAGIAQIIHAFAVQKWSEFLLNLLVGALYVLAGGWLAFFTLSGILTLTAFLAVIFVIQGALETSLAVRMRPTEGLVVDADRRRCGHRRRHSDFGGATEFGRVGYRPARRHQLDLVGLGLRLSRFGGTQACRERQSANG